MVFKPLKETPPQRAQNVLSQKVVPRGRQSQHMAAASDSERKEEEEEEEEVCT